MTEPRRPRSRHSFTLVELLVVVSIIAIAFSMIAFLPSGAKRDADVQSAAEELASTLRLARSLAMDRHAVYGVSFNIQNAPGTSGKVLNNWSGGHWYRIIGPNDNAAHNNNQDAFSIYPMPSFQPYTTPPYMVADYLDAVKNCWVGDRHVLPARKVRFLALTDQDNGGVVYSDWFGGSLGTFVPTYPRPWFGFWDSATKRLYPWGGYDSTIRDAQTPAKECSGFYFAGKEGPIVGCVNPSTRSSSDGRAQLLVAGQGRALVNGEWEDYLLSFLPNGDVAEAQVQGLRFNTRGFNKELSDMSCDNNASDPGSPVLEWHPQMVMTSTGMATPVSPMTSYVQHTGFWSITLAPDIVADSDAFASSSEALRTIMPAYRVMINAAGFVKVVKVRPFANDVTFDPTIATAADWSTRAKTSVYYQHDIATDSAGMLRGMPVSDFLTADLLASRNWWMVPKP